MGYESLNLMKVSFHTEIPRGPKTHSVGLSAAGGANISIRKDLEHDLWWNRQGEIGAIHFMLPGPDGLVRLRVLPKGGRSIAVAVGDLMRELDLPVREMFVERGALDAVFREITLSSPAGGAPGDGAHG